VWTDVGSGLNENRKNLVKFLEIIADRRVSKVTVTYESRLIRFGFKTLRKLFSAFNIAIKVINHEEESLKRNFVRDLITIVLHSAGKLYGLKGYKYKELLKMSNSLYQVRAYSIKHDYDV